MVTQKPTAKRRRRKPQAALGQPQTLSELAARVRAGVPASEWQRLPKDFATRLDEMLETPEGGR